VHTYEIVAVLRPDLDEEALGAAIERIQQRVVEHGGTMVASERWGKRRTAYPIRKYREAYYVLLVVSLDAGQVTPLRQTLRLHEDLLRFTLASHSPSPAGATPSAGTAAPAAGAAPGPASPGPEGGPPAASMEGAHV